MAGNQTNNLLILDLVSGLPRTPETGGTPDTLQLGVDFQLVNGANLLVDGDLVVNGTTTTVHSESVLLADNHLYLNAGYTTTAAQTGGLVANVLPTSTNDTVAAGGFTAGVAATSNPTVITTGSATFTAGDLIQVSGASHSSNNGLFEVLDHTGTTLTIRGIGTSATTQEWVQNQFVTDSTAQGTITLVNVNVLRGNSSGEWETFTGNSTTGLTYETFSKQGVVDLQEAYEQGSTITTSGGDGNVVITGTESLQVTATGGLEVTTLFDFNGTSFDVEMSGTNGFSIDGTNNSNVTVTNGDLTLSTATSGDVLITGAGGVDLTAGSGAFSLESSTAETSALVTLTTTGTNGDSVALFVGESDPSSGGGVTADVGSLFFRDSGGAGTTGQLWLKTGASDSAWQIIQVGVGAATLQSAYENGNTIDITSVQGAVTLRNSTNSDTTSILSVSRAPSSSTAGLGLDVDLGVNTTGTAVLINQQGSGNALDVQDGGSSVLVVDGSGGVSLSPTSGQDLSVTVAGVGAVEVGTGAGGVDVNAGGPISLAAVSASDFTVTGANLTLATVTSGNVLVNGTSGVALNSSGGALSLGNEAHAHPINIGTGAAARTITVGNGTGATAVDLVAGTGAFSLTSTVAETSPLTTLVTTGTNGDSVDLFIGESDPDGVVTGQAASVFFRDTGSTGELWLNTSNGSGTTWSQVVTSGAGGTLTLQTAYEGGNTVTTAAVDGDLTFTGTEDLVVSLADVLVDVTTISLDATAASNFTVDGAALTLSTTTSGRISIASADDVEITFGTNDSTAMVVDDGSSNFLTFDSTTGDLAVEVNQFLDLVGRGAGVSLTAATTISVGNLLVVNTSGQAILGDSDGAEDELAYVVGVAATAATSTNPVRVFTTPGSLVPVLFGAAPSSSDNGNVVFLSSTPGVATLTAPTDSGNIIYKIGILQGADGSTTTPTVLFQPQYLSKRP